MKYNLGNPTLPNIISSWHRPAVYQTIPLVYLIASLSFMLILATYFHFGIAPGINILSSTGGGGMPYGLIFDFFFWSYLTIETLLTAIAAYFVLTRRHKLGWPLAALLFNLPGFVISIAVFDIHPNPAPPSQIPPPTLFDQVVVPLAIIPPATMVIFLILGWKSRRQSYDAK